MLNDKITWYHDSDVFLNTISKYIKETDIVLDIGCGIVPMNYFRPSLHIMLEPYKEYVDILLHRHQNDKSIFILSGTAQEMLSHFTDNSVDTIFLIDVIEHFEKQHGFEVIHQCERIAREQIIIFTPLGLMPQHAEQGETDGWGLSGIDFQEHLSGWLPEDFGETWDFYIDETFHQYDFRQQPLDEPYGAMFAIKSFQNKTTPQPSKFVHIRRPLPSELVLSQTQASLAQTQASLTQTQASLTQTQTALFQTLAQLAEANRILSHPVIRAQRKLWRTLKFWS